ncbi:MAG: hypothetical protein K8S94_09975 [Planctomycetia bacterium]|nr:hypothetical protein [Planctomycetia bacterium]
MLSLLLWLIPHRSMSGPCRVVAGCLGVFIVSMATAAEGDAPPTKPADLGVTIVPRDAAFLSSSLRLREQYDRIVTSNAFAALKSLPVIARALDSIDEQRTTPGSPFSTFDTFMQLPENERAVELLTDMISTDTFVYGEPSCISFWQLLRKLTAAQQRAGIGAAGAGIDIEEDVDEEEDADDEDLAVEVGGDLDAGRAARLVLETLADNLDLVVVPDVVWGFKTTKREIGADQLKRIGVLAKMLLDGDPELAESFERRKVAGTEMLTFTLDGERVPWDDLEREVIDATGDEDLVAKVFDRLRSLDVVVALGLVGDWVILSVGDSVDHLEKLALPGSDKQGLVTLPAFKPLLDHLDKRITGISYMSESLNEAVGPSRSDIESIALITDELDDDGLSDEAQADVRELAERAADEYAKRLPKPGPWTAVSFLAEQGYEGYVWNWARNQPFDGSKRLDLLEHTGGAPLGVLVSRIKSDPAAFDAAADLTRSAWKLFEKHGRPRLSDEDGERFDEFAEHVAPLGDKLATILRDKLMKSLADGQIGLVLDAKARTKRPQAELPASSDPLPLVEPAIVLPLDDPKLFREGLSDLFALGDELTEAVREMNPDAVPAGYRIPEPEKSKSDGGSVWSWALTNSRLDEQVRPAIGVGEKAVVFSLVPKQIGRMLVESRLETGAQLTKFDEPLAGAAALDFAGLVDVLQPWIVYVTRYGCVQERDGSVDPDTELTAADENEQAKEALEHAKVVLEALKSLRAAVAETSFRDDALVTHWRNVIRDMPAK